MSIAVAVGSFVTAYLWWTVDWWRPETITGTRVGVEDLLLGFTNGGIAAVLYTELFRRKVRRGKFRRHNRGTLFLFLLLVGIISLLFWGFQVNSSIASFMGMLVAGLLILYLRKDLLTDAVLSGILTMLASLPVYWLLTFLSPGWVEATWLMDEISGALVTGIPIEDLVFYFFFGFIIGPFYEYWQGQRLKKLS